MGYGNSSGSKGWYVTYCANTEKTLEFGIGNNIYPDTTRIKAIDTFSVQSSPLIWRKFEIKFRKHDSTLQTWRNDTLVYTYNSFFYHDSTADFTNYTFCVGVVGQGPNEWLINMDTTIHSYFIGYMQHLKIIVNGTVFVNYKFDEGADRLSGTQLLGQYLIEPAPILHCIWVIIWN